jgi:hypothetical protein
MPCLVFVFLHAKNIFQSKSYYIIRIFIDRDLFHYFLPIYSKTTIASSPRKACPKVPALHNLIFYFLEKEDGKYCLQLLLEGSNYNCLYNLATKLLQKKNWCSLSFEDFL